LKRPTGLEVPRGVRIDPSPGPATARRYAQLLRGIIPTGPQRRAGQAARKVVQFTRSCRGEPRASPGLAQEAGKVGVPDRRAFVKQRVSALAAQSCARHCGLNHPLFAIGKRRIALVGLSQRSVALLRLGA
jgi:hypothetical protein